MQRIIRSKLTDLLYYPIVVTDCGIPLSPTNGYVEYSSTGLHSIATYHCNKNHILLGYDTTQCVIGGKWDGVVPLCRSMYVCTLVNEATCVLQIIYVCRSFC